MKQIHDMKDLKDTGLYWTPEIRHSGFLIYWLVIVLVSIAVLSLFLIRVDVCVRATGIVRPLNERTEIRSPSGGIIENIYFKEGDLVPENKILMVLRDSALAEKQRLNESALYQCRNMVHDLELLTREEKVYGTILPALKCPLYKEQALRFFSGEQERQILLSKASHERVLNEKLAEDKVISPKEIYDIRNQEQKIVAEKETYGRAQQAEWHTDLLKYKAELNQYVGRKEELDQLFEMNRIRAPVTGYLQEINKYYSGITLQAGEPVCTISPGGPLIGECYVPSKDIGLLKNGQAARFLIDAFNYNYFGAASGSIFSIDNDFILLDKIPVYKVRCRLNESRMKLSDGFSGAIKKGMSFRVRFITCQRTLWQLLYDNLNEWMNPPETGLK